MRRTATGRLRPWRLFFTLALCLTGAAPGPADAFVYVVNSGIGNPGYPATVSQYDTVDGTLTPLDPQP